MEEKGQFHTLATLASGKIPRYLVKGGGGVMLLPGPRKCSGSFRENIHCPCQESNHESSDVYSTA